MQNLELFYGPKTTFLSVIPKSNWIQINNEKIPQIT